MYKQHLLQNIEREIVLLKQLAPLIEEKDLEYKPMDKVRTTHELMMYLSTIGSSMIRWLHKNDLTPEFWEGVREYRNTLTIENFEERLDADLILIKKYMDEITEEELFNKEAILPTKEKMVLGAAIINAPIKWLAVYRMELFLYLKMTGREGISTKEAWVIQ